MKFLITIFIGCVICANTFAQNRSITQLRNLADSLSKAAHLHRQKILAFNFIAKSRSDHSALVVDIRNNAPIYRAPLNANASFTTGASKLQNGVMGLNLEGKGLTLGMWDDGKIQSHDELTNRILSNEGSSFKEHATHVSGTLVAAGINPSAKGMAPKANVAAWYFDNDEAEMAAQARTDHTSLLFSNHSYGQVTGWRRDNNAWKWTGDSQISADEDFYFGFYTNRARVIDQIAYLAPYYTIVWAAGNDRAETGDGTHPPDCNSGTGYDCVIPDAVGKNMITVGAVDKVMSYTGPSSISMSSFSSWGPTDDGRIKPDLVGDGVNVFSLSANGVTNYSVSGGTSMAAPNVTGSLALLQELYSKLHGGQYMRASTLKALAIHTAKEAGSFAGPDFSFGWGLLDVEAGARLLLQEDKVNVSVQELTLSNGDRMDLVLQPKSNTKITATVVWTDPPGKPVADKLDPTDKMLVNDLDMKITDDAGNEILPWVLNPGTPALAAIKGNNSRDNVEKIEFELPLLKEYHLAITHKGQLSGGKQNFSLIINYQSVNAVRQNFYWVGDSGDWSDATHWAAISGGAPVNKTPSKDDHVIIDENSFDDVDSDQIRLSQNQAVGSLTWINSKPSSLSLNGKTLEVSKSLIIGSANLNISSSGTIRCFSATNGKISVSDAHLDLADLIVAGGSWSWRGNAHINELILESGNLSIEHSKINAKHLISSSTSFRSWSFINSVIEIGSDSEVNSSGLTLSATNSAFRITEASVVFNWKGLTWPGDFVIDNGGAIVHGNNVFRKAIIAGRLELTGSNTWDSLLLKPAASVLLANASNQNISNMVVESTSSQPVSIRSPAMASMTFLSRQKFCFENVRIDNMEAKGIALVNAGVSSTLNNTKGWLNQKCNDVLFADFTYKYACENGMAQLIDRSSGNPQQWIWTLPAGITNSNRTIDFLFTESGTQPVTLTVSKANNTNSYTALVDVKQNTLSANEIVVNSDALYSFNQASAYQWYKDEVMITNETGRSFAYQGMDGVYSVVTFGDVCNRLSNKTVITAIYEHDRGINVYPNPANELIMIKQTNSDFTISLLDRIGRVLQVVHAEAGVYSVPVNQYNEGIYFVEVKTKDQTFREKILIRH